MMDFVIWCVILALAVFVGGLVINLLFMALFVVVGVIASLVGWLWGLIRGV